MWKDISLWEALLIWAALGAFSWGDDEAAQELYDEWYSPEEIADELDMDEEEVREIVDDWDE